ncbi:NTP transferase domain-containing protein [Frateuria sp. GZRe12]|uniref:NTP transferase domain-containing protein n=1 Tax=Frateuria sp. GZRe12 TaxID=3351533 RepID=UPI003EDC2B3B
MYPVEGAVIACAGLGSRLGLGLPKCMIEIGGRTILSRLIESLSARVPRIHVVVGYREELVIEHCARFHREVILVRSPSFRDTNTAHSLRLGSVGFKRKVLYLDGDLILDESTLDRFMTRAAEVDLLVGATRAKSEQAVFVSTESDLDGQPVSVTGFHRSPPSSLEWANVFAGSPALLQEGNRFVYECIEPELPAAATRIDLFEIDTPDDLATATSALAANAFPSA